MATRIAAALQRAPRGGAAAAARKPSTHAAGAGRSCGGALRRRAIAPAARATAGRRAPTAPSPEWAGRARPTAPTRQNAIASIRCAAEEAPGRAREKPGQRSAGRDTEHGDLRGLAEPAGKHGVEERADRARGVDRPEADRRSRASAPGERAQRLDRRCDDEGSREPGPSSGSSRRASAVPAARARPRRSRRRRREPDRDGEDEFGAPRRAPSALPTRRGRTPDERSSISWSSGRGRSSAGSIQAAAAASASGSADLSTTSTRLPSGRKLGYEPTSTAGWRALHLPQHVDDAALGRPVRAPPGVDRGAAARALARSISNIASISAGSPGRT